MILRDGFQQEKEDWHDLDSMLAGLQEKLDKASQELQRLQARSHMHFCRSQSESGSEEAKESEFAIVFVCALNTKVS